MQQNTIFPQHKVLQNKKIQVEETLAMRPAVVVPYTKARVRNVETNIFILFKWVGSCYVFGLFYVLDDLCTNV